MTGSTSQDRARDAVRAGREALAQQAWAEARRWFELALSHEQTAEALEGLGLAAARLGDGQTAIDAHKRAYWRHQLRNDWRSAARLARDWRLNTTPSSRIWRWPSPGWRRRVSVWLGWKPCPSMAG